MKRARFIRKVLIGMDCGADADVVLFIRDDDDR